MRRPTATISILALACAAVVAPVRAATLLVAHEVEVKPAGGAGNLRQHRVRHNVDRAMARRATDPKELLRVRTSSFRNGFIALVR